MKISEASSHLNDAADGNVHAARQITVSVQWRRELKRGNRFVNRTSKWERLLFASRQTENRNSQSLTVAIIALHYFAFISTRF